MKKIRWFSLLLSLCLLLSACGAQVPERKDESPEQSVQTPEKSNQEPEAAPEPEVVCGPAFEEIPSMEDYYQHGNMQINVPSGDFIRYNSEVLFTVRSDSFLCAYDLKSGQVRHFCIAQGCDHSDDVCDTVANCQNLEQYDGKLFMNFEYGVKVLVDGKWSDDEWTDLVKRNKLFWHGDGDLYLRTQKGKLQVCDDGTEEPRTLLEDYGYYWNVVFDGYLYGSDIDEVVRVDLSSESPVKEVLLENVHTTVEGNHIYYTDEENFYLYRCDMDGTNHQLLLEKTVLPASINFDEEYLYFRLYTDKQMKGTADSQDVYRMSKEDPTQIEKIATLPESAYQIFTVPGVDILFVTACVHYDEDGNDRENIYVMRTDGSEMVKLDLPGYA